MGRKTFIILLSIMAVAIGALIWLNIDMDSRTPWIKVYEMANKNIEWTGAGYFR